VKFGLFVVAPLVALAAIAIKPASAAVHTFNLSYSDAPDLINNTYVLGGNTGRLRGFLEASSPFAINGFQSGDTISVNFNVGGAGLHLQDTGNPFIGNQENFGLGGFVLDGWNQSVSNPTQQIIYTADVQIAFTATGYTGALVSPSLSQALNGYQARGAFLPSFITANVTNSSVWLTSFNITTTLNNLQFANDFSYLALPANFTSLGVMFAADDLPVPAPGALALLGLGLLGIGGLRRKKTT
jgi:hypothetical protein